MKIRKQQPYARIDRKIAQSVEHVVAAVVGQKQRSRIFDADEARIAAAMGSIRS